MKTQKTLKTIALLLVMTLVSFSCSDDDDDNNIITQPMALNIVETAVSVPDLSILVNALQMADGDLVSVNVTGSDLLKKYGWPEGFSQKSISASYLVGFVGFVNKTRLR